MYYHVDRFFLKTGSMSLAYHCHRYSMSNPVSIVRRVKPGFYPEKRELQRSIETYDMRYFPQHVLLCTSSVHDQSANICIQGYSRILWLGNTRSSKIDKIHKCYVLCFKLEYFFKSCKTWPLNATSMAVRCQSKNITWNRIMACRDSIDP